MLAYVRRTATAAISRPSPNVPVPGIRPGPHGVAVRTNRRSRAKAGSDGPGSSASRGRMKGSVPALVSGTGRRSQLKKRNHLLLTAEFRRQVQRGPSVPVALPRARTRNHAPTHV